MVSSNGRPIDLGRGQLGLHLRAEPSTDLRVAAASRLSLIQHMRRTAKTAFLHLETIAKILQAGFRIRGDRKKG